MCLYTTGYYGCGHKSKGGPYRMYFQSINLTRPGLGIALLIFTSCIPAYGKYMSFYNDDDRVEEIPYLKQIL